MQCGRLAERRLVVIRICEHCHFKMVRNACVLGICDTPCFHEVTVMLGICRTPYGHKVFSKNRSGFVMMIRPTSELWTVSLPHRTQILYTPDISLILMRLEVRPGHVVIESGTGSGSMTTAMARCVGPKGISDFSTPPRYQLQLQVRIFRGYASRLPWSTESTFLRKRSQQDRHASTIDA